MTSIVITEEQKKALEQFLKKHRKIDLVSAYLFFLQMKFKMQPVVFLKEKKIYRSAEELINRLQEQGQLWRETEVIISLGQPTVNEQTTKIYICPFCGKVFGDNTHPNPQDAIYDWVSRCPENHERVGGLRVKRFFVSDDPEMIKNYIAPRKTTIRKTAYSSIASGKLFNSTAGIIDDFRKNQIRSLSMSEIQNQNRFEIEPKFLEFLHTLLQEDKITQVVEALADDPRFEPYITQWTEDEESSG